MSDIIRKGGDKNWNASTSSESYQPSCNVRAVSIDSAHNTKNTNWVELTLQHVRDETVEEVMQRLHKVRGPIPHSVLKLIFKEMGYEY